MSQEKDEMSMLRTILSFRQEFEDIDINLLTMTKGGIENFYNLLRDKIKQ